MLTYGRAPKRWILYEAAATHCFQPNLFSREEISACAFPSTPQKNVKVTVVWRSEALFGNILQGVCVSCTPLEAKILLPAARASFPDAKIVWLISPSTQQSTLSINNNMMII